MDIIDDIEAKIRQYDKLVYRVINDLKYIPNYVDREEIKQVAVIALWKALNEYEEDRKVKIINYLYNKIRNELIDYLRKMEITLGREYLPEFETQLEVESAEDSTIEGMLISEVRRIIPNKTEADIFIDRHAYRYTFEELKTKYNKSRMTLDRILNKIKEQLQKELDWDD